MARVVAAAANTVAGVKAAVMHKSGRMGVGVGVGVRVPAMPAVAMPAVAMPAGAGAVAVAVAVAVVALRSNQGAAQRPEAQRMAAVVVAVGEGPRGVNVLVPRVAQNLLIAAVPNGVSQHKVLFRESGCQGPQMVVARLVLALTDALASRPRPQHAHTHARVMDVVVHLRLALTCTHTAGAMAAGTVASVKHAVQGVDRRRQMHVVRTLMEVVRVVVLVEKRVGGNGLGSRLREGVVDRQAALQRVVCGISRW